MNGITDNWLMGAYEYIGMMDDLIDNRPIKPMNTRTRKTAWKERRRRANLPRSIKRRGGAKWK